MQYHQSTIQGSEFDFYRWCCCGGGSGGDITIYTLAVYLTLKFVLIHPIYRWECKIGYQFHIEACPVSNQSVFFCRAVSCKWCSFTVFWSLNNVPIYYQIIKLTWKMFSKRNKNWKIDKKNFVVFVFVHTFNIDI